MFYLIIVITMIASGGVGWMLKKRFKEFSEIPIGMTGKEIAEKMLRDNGITDVQVVSVPGALTDHYNPANKTVNLSDWVYGQATVAAAAVAAHECGHAVQHARAYTWLTMRSQLVPVVNVASRLNQWIILAGFAMLGFMHSPILLIIGIVAFALTTLFAFVTLPVEFDASNRALAWLGEARDVMNNEQHEKAKNALWWAAMTYVVAALGSLAQLLYYISIFLRSRD
jgi:Zn-dependent membrane protease YugP